MGTRNLTCVFYDKKYRIAQYGQWDGYPSGQGVTVLAFLKKVKSARMEKFKELLKKIRFLTDADLKEIDRKYPEGAWLKHYPQLSRDHGAGILQIVYDAGRGLVLKDSLDFAGDSLFCEFCYVVDLDTNMFEIYEGFNKDEVTNGRFVSGKNSRPDTLSGGEYHPVGLRKAYSLSNLPSKKQFLEDLKDEDEDE